MKVALIHDFLAEFGGAERVLMALHQIFPQAPVYVAFVDQDRLGSDWNRFKDWDIRQSYISKLPFYKKLYSPYRVFAASAFKSFDLNDYDILISSSNAYQAKAVRGSKSHHFSYCHTPPRSLYGYNTGIDWQKKGLVHFIGSLINVYMKGVDQASAQNVDDFIANSQEVAARIKKFYHRDSAIIHPPVTFNQERDKILPWKNRKHYLYINRLNFAKHPRLAIQAAIDLDLDLKVLGTGPDKKIVEKMAQNHSNIKFLGKVSDNRLHRLYSQAKALLYPVEDEDFGMIPIEAMSYGVPVIAHRSGGPIETIKEGKTGLFFDQLVVSDVKQAIIRVQNINFDLDYMFQHSQKYSFESFKEGILNLIDSKVKNSIETCLH